MAKNSVEKYADALEKISEKEKKIMNFSDLLMSINDLDDKKKILWREIYDNAINDRENASILFTDTLMQVKGNAANHNILGPVISKYLERMSRANDQILKLAELVGKEDAKTMSTDSIFDKINNFED
jgi:F0F1-type ATP synthase delta subunit